jgi:hypothetical protein
MSSRGRKQPHFLPFSQIGSCTQSLTDYVFSFAAPNTLSDLKAKLKGFLKGKKTKEEKPVEAAKPTEPTPAAAPTETTTATDATPAPVPAGKSPCLLCFLICADNLL